MYQNFISLGGFEFIATLANTLILYLLFKKFLFKPVKAMMDKRQSEVAGAFIEADEAKLKAKQLEAEYVLKISEAKGEAAQIVRDASKRGENRYEEIVTQAKTEADRLKNKAASDIEQEKKKAVNEIKDEISDIAMMIASKVIEKDINKNDHQRLINDFIDNVGDTSWQN